SGGGRCRPRRVRAHDRGRRSDGRRLTPGARPRPARNAAERPSVRAFGVREDDRSDRNNAATAYRVRTDTTRGGKRARSITQPFERFGDANRWAMGFCRTTAGKTTAVVVTADGQETAAYHGDNGLITACL